jgi:hypothetical protein
MKWRPKVGWVLIVNYGLVTLDQNLKQMDMVVFATYLVQYKQFHICTKKIFLKPTNIIIRDLIFFFIEVKSKVEILN